MKPEQALCLILDDDDDDDDDILSKVLITNLLFSQNVCLSVVKML